MRWGWEDGGGSAAAQQHLSEAGVKGTFKPAGAVGVGVGGGARWLHQQMVHRRCGALHTTRREASHKPVELIRRMRKEKNDVEPGVCSYQCFFGSLHEITV